MKKYVFGFLLIGTFVSYVAYVQLNGGLEQKPSIVVIGSTTPTSTDSSPVPTSVPLPLFEDDEEEDMIRTTPTPLAPTMMAQPMPMRGKIYRDGTYTGPIVDVYYGNVQVKAIITNGAITDVQFLDYPKTQDRSQKINTYALPLLKQEAIAAQQANVNVVSGATATSGGFKTSLSAALAQAKI